VSGASKVSGGRGVRVGRAVGRGEGVGAGRAEEEGRAEGEGRADGLADGVGAGLADAEGEGEGEASSWRRSSPLRLMLMRVVNGRSVAAGCGELCASAAHGNAKSTSPRLSLRAVSRLSTTYDIGRTGRKLQPTAPSISSLISRLSSTAYSIGSSLTKKSKNPLTIIAVASASLKPRLIA
jgi:hypothetical protein